MSDLWVTSPRNDRSLVEMAQVQPHEPEPVKPIAAFDKNIPTALEPDSNESQITLHQAARDGRIDVIEFHIRKFQKLSSALRLKRLNKRDENRTTALHYAIRYGHVDIVKMLLNSGASLTREGEDGATPLHYAARFRSVKLKPSNVHVSLTDQDLVQLEQDLERNGNLNLGLQQDEYSPNVEDESLINILVARGADVNYQDKYGWTPLHFAACKRNIVATNELLAFDQIEVDLLDTSGQTALHLAAKEGDKEVVHALLKSGANPCAKDNERMTPLHFAASEGKMEVILQLFRAVENSQGPEAVSKMVNEKNNEDETVLHAAVEGGYPAVVEMCLEKGASVRAVKSNLAQPLHLAAINGHVEIAKLLIRRKANIEARNIYYETPLHMAASFNRIPMVELLLSRKVNIESRNNENLTPLLMAVSAGHTHLLQIFLKHGASLKAKDIHDNSAIFLAAKENNEETLRVLLEHPDAKLLVDETDLYENTPLHIACTKGFASIAALLLENEAKVDARNEDENTPLHLTAENGKIKCLKELLKYDPSILNDEDESSNTALHLASLEGHVKCVRELLEHGAEVDARNNLLWTPLDCAAAKGQVKTAEVLLEYDAPVDPVDKAKTTPLHLAAKGGHEKLVKLLLSHGADISLADHTGRNCLDLAIDNGHKDCAIVIINDENWMVAMRSKTMEQKTATTPMRKLICKLPDVAEMVFNKCVGDNGKQPDNLHYEVRLNYELLEDVYEDWCNSTTDSDAISVNSVQQNVQEAVGVYQRINGKKQEEEAIRQLEDKENHPLMLMVSTKREHLLSHPLVTFLLQYKWRTFGRYVYYTKLLMYCLFLFFLTTYTVYTTKNAPEQLNNTCVSKFDKNSAEYLVWVTLGKWFIIILAGWHIMTELFQMVYRFKQYISVENFLEWPVFVLAIVYVAESPDSAFLQTKDRCWLAKQSLGAVSIFLAWANLVLFIRKFPLLGIYVVMFTDILRTFLKFSLIFVLFIVSFALSFYTLLHSQNEFKTPVRSIFKTGVMMIGEFDFTSLFYPSDDFEIPDVTWVLFIVFVIVITLLLMNLLIGLAVDDIKAVQEQAVLTRHAMLVDLALDVEKALPRKLRKKLMTTYEALQPNKMHGMMAYFNKPAISPMELQVALKPERTALERLEQQNDTLQHAVASMRIRMKTMQTQQDDLMAMMKAVVTKLEAIVDDDSEKGELD